MTKKNKNKNVAPKSKYGKCATKVAELLRKKFPSLSKEEAWDAIDAAAHLRYYGINGMAKDLALEYIYDNFGDAKGVDFDLPDISILDAMDEDDLPVYGVKLDEEPVEGFPDAERVLDESMSLLSFCLMCRMLQEVTRTEIVNLLETGVCPECQKKLELMKN